MKAKSALPDRIHLIASILPRQTQMPVLWVIFGFLFITRLTFFVLGIPVYYRELVVSSPAVAALLNLLRKRLQERIDRLFYRQKYDAEKIVASFSGMARQQTDLDALTGQLIEAVQRSLHPECMSIWIKKPSGAAK